ncbi:glycogen debranching N-terminal domain-containing protein [Diaminobutyricimonas sp. LJ205]|uniref:glycogen debranching N-terminal domain-containing protein n=1 Tax=Diaminobutyricimonas sp. LJ205 TaxID=2683590 RepID=UPI0018DF9707|nr:glycogen debranching N-terminal domain-containing protein [Diaminobutyricimonas sp. LJ205]
MTDTVSILNGNTFVVSDVVGDIESSPTDPTGLFSFDTRFLSKWVLTVDGERLTSLSTDDLHYFEARFFLVPGVGSVYVNATMSVIRQRSVGNGFTEVLSILNHDDQPVDVTVRIDAASDFADLFEVKDALAKKGSYSTKVAGRSLELEYQRDTYHRSTAISSTEECSVDEDGLTFTVTIGSHEAWSTELEVAIEVLQQEVQGQGRSISEQVKRPIPDMAANLARWLDEAPRLGCDWETLVRTYQRSLVDLAALRFSPLTAGRNSLPAAGLPWFMTMFGRDSIFTSLQVLPFGSELARTTLRELGLRQGTRTDDFRTRIPVASCTRCGSAN